MGIFERRILEISNCPKEVRYNKINTYKKKSGV